MLMDVGYRILCSLRQVDSRRRSLSSPPGAFLFTSHVKSHKVNMEICSRYCWYGKPKVVNDDKLMNVLGEIVRFGAVLNCWRSWISNSEYVAVRCMFHKSMTFASIEARDNGLISNDEHNLSPNGEDQLMLLKTRKNGEETSLAEVSGQLEKIELSHSLWQDDKSTKKHSLPTDLHEASETSAECLMDVAVIVFDIETTGFKLLDDRIIEFAACDLAGGDFSTIQTLVNPDKQVPLHATNIHGIYSEMVNNANIPRWSEVAPVLTQFVESRRIAGGPVFLVAHNGKRFDVPFLLKEFERCSLKVPPWWQFIDSVPIAREAMKAKGEKYPLRLSALYEYYKLPYVGEAHRALTDVHMLARVLQMLLADLKMPCSEFLKKAFTTKDVLHSALSNAQNLEVFSPEFDLNSELSAEVEDSSEASGAQCETVSNLYAPWDDIEAEGQDDGLKDTSLKHEEEIDSNPTMKSLPEMNKEMVQMNSFTHEPSVASLSLLSKCGVVHNYNHILKPVDTELQHLFPILREYLSIKSERPDVLMLLRTGEFHQAFFEDAKKLSETCDVALCAIRGGEILDGLVPMASLHCDDSDVYALRLQAEGVSIYRQDQVGRLVNDGSTWPFLISNSMPAIARVLRNSDESLGSFFVAVVPPDNEDGTWGLAYTDISTGVLYSSEGQGQRSLIEEIATLDPSEILCSGNASKDTTDPFACRLPMTYSYSFRPPEQFSLAYGKKKLQKFFNSEAHEECGLKSSDGATCAVGGLLGFLEEIQGSKKFSFSFRKLSFYGHHDCMLLDQYTRSCLEVFQSKRQGQRFGSLFWAIDHTMTRMGKRLLRQWLLRPLVDKESICLRHDAVEVLVQSPKLREQVRHSLSLLNDLERLSGKILFDKLCPWNLLALGQSIGILQTMHSTLETHPNPYFVALTCPTSLYDLGKKLRKCFEVEASSILLLDGHIIKNDVDEALHELRKEMLSLDASLEDFKRVEQDRTGISSLELLQRENGDFFISVQKPVPADTSFPADYQLCSSETLKDAFFFNTSSLFKHNKKRSELAEKLKVKESSILESLRSEVLAFLTPLQILSEAVAALDVLATFAEVASLRQYCKPVVLSNSRQIKVTGARHPSAELCMSERAMFNANSLYMGFEPEMDKQTPSLTSDLNNLGVADSKQHWPCPDVVILTGPPASGKSCYVQQAGLIQILAQTGSYVPAKEAVLGIADAIFMKIEDSSDSSIGQSSFELHMSQCASILKDATSQSLVLLDSMDRGLSLNDDGAVARSIVEYLAQNVKARTILTTQNSNLASLEGELSNVANFQSIDNNDPLFPFYVKPGFYFEPSINALDKIDGLPNWISKRAAELISKNDTTAEEAFHSEHKLNGNIHQLHKDPLKQDTGDGQGVIQLAEQSSDPEQSESSETTIESALNELSFPSDNSTQGGAFEAEKEYKAISKRIFSRTDPEQYTSSSDASNTAASPLSSGIPEMTQSSNDLEEPESYKTKPLQETWRLVLQALKDYPVTHALAKQKGTLVSVNMLTGISEVHITTSNLFLKKFLQEEHAAALENAFIIAIRSPIHLKITASI